MIKGKLVSLNALSTVSDLEKIKKVSSDRYGNGKEKFDSDRC